MHWPPTPFLLMVLAPFALWAILFIVAKLNRVSLKPLMPWIAGACWLLWGLGSIPFLENKRWGTAAMTCYAGMTLLLGWIKRSYLFGSDPKPSGSLASLLTISLPTSIAADNPNILYQWYAEKLGLRKLADSEQPRSDGVALQFDEKSNTVTLVRRDPVAPRPAPVFFSRKLRKVRELLISRGVSAGPIQQDRQGTRFFELLDGEGNPLEISERP
jgi:hypothetical protein